MFSMPKLLTDKSLYFNDESNFAGLIIRQDLPTLDWMKEVFAIPGGKVSIYKRLEEMTSTYVMREFTRELIGFSPMTRARFITKGFQTDGNGNEESVQVECEGNIGSNNLGAWEDENIPENSFRLDLKYIAYKIENETIIEIDLINTKAIYNGVDIWEKRREALGLS